MKTCLALFFTLVILLNAQNSDLQEMSHLEWGNCNSVMPRDNILYMNTGRLLKIYNVADVSNPVKLNTLKFENIIKEIVYNEDVLFVLTRNNVVHLLSIEDATNPIEFSTITPPETYETINTIYPIDQVLLLGTQLSGVLVYTVNDNPSFIYGLSDDNQFISVTQLSVKENQLYILDPVRGITIYDFSERMPVRFIKVDDTNYPYGNISAFVTSDDYIYYTDKRKFLISSLSDTSVLYTYERYRYNAANKMMIEDNRLIIGGDAFVVLDISNPINPRQVNFSQKFMNNRDLYVKDGVLYYVTWSEIKIYEYGLQYVQKSSIVAGEEVTDFTLRDKFAYLTDRTAGLRIFDINNLEEPKELSRFIENIGYNFIHLYNDLAILMQGGVWIVDISDPYNPQKLSYFNDEGYWIRTTAFDGRYIYFTSYDKVIIFDLVDPRYPKRISDPGIFNYHKTMFTDEKFLYLGGIAGFAIYDKSDIHNLQLVYSDNSRNPIKIVKDGERLYLLEDASLSIYKINESGEPELLSKTAIASNALTFSITGNYGYISFKNKKMAVYDLSDPYLPQLQQSFSVVSNGYVLSAQNDYLFSSHKGEGFTISKNSQILHQNVYDFNLAESYVPPRKDIPVEVVIKPSYGTDLGNFELSLKKDENLAFEGIHLGSLISENNWQFSVFSSGGFITISGSGDVVKGQGDLLNLIFSVSDSADYRFYPIEFTDLEVNGLNENITSSNGGIQLINPAAGDANQDGVVDARDVMEILSFLTGQTEFTDRQIQNSNVTGDSTVSALDAAMIKRYLAGYYKFLPVEDMAFSAGGKVKLFMDDETVISPNSIAIELRVRQDINSHALSGAIEYDPQYLTFKNVEWKYPTRTYTMFKAVDGNKVRFAIAKEYLAPKEPILGVFNFELNDASINSSKLILTDVRVNEEETVLNMDQATIINLVTGIGENESAFPKKLTLKENYPNPFNPSTRIRFGVHEKRNISINIYNALGKLVKQLVDQDYNPGWYEAEWDGKNETGNAVGSGLYFVSLKDGISYRRQKILLLK
jgi:hypothetical protein